VRAALDPFEGIHSLAVAPGNRAIAVDHDSAAVTTQEILAALEKGGRPAKLQPVHPPGSDG